MGHWKSDATVARQDSLIAVHIVVSVFFQPASLKGCTTIKKPAKPRAHRIVGTPGELKIHTGILVRSLCEALCPLWNLEDPGHWSSPPVLFNDIGSFKFHRQHDQETL